MKEVEELAKKEKGDEQLPSETAYLSVTIKAILQIFIFYGNRKSVSLSLNRISKLNFLSQPIIQFLRCFIGKYFRFEFSSFGTLFKEGSRM